MCPQLSKSDQLVAGSRLANVTNMILVTNSYFTSEVKIRALKLGVELFDRDGLQDLYIKKHSEIGREIKPRFYQQAIIDEATAQYESGKKKLLIEMATGLGKTYTAAHLLKKIILNKNSRVRVLFLAHQVEILLQSVTSFKNVLGISSYSYSACFDGASPENTDFVFATFDTLHTKLYELKKDLFDFIVVDEAHHAPAKTYSDVITNFSPKLLIGLTATPFRDDNKSVIDFFGGYDSHIGRYDLAWGLKNKYLAFPKYEVLLNDIDEKKISQLSIGIDIKDLDKHLFLHKKDSEVLKIIESTVFEKKIENVKGIIFCKNIKHMKHLLKFFDLGAATFVHSKMKDCERRDNIRNFREGGYKYILVCDLFNEGIDIPETNLLVFMRQTGSRRIWLQQLGRGLRKTKTKNFINVLDFVGSLERIYEIKELERDVNSKTYERVHEKLLDHESDDFGDFLHDSSIEVSFSKSAADVFKLIEEYKIKLGFRDVLLSAIRNYFNANKNIPKIESLENELSGISLNEISTCFDSYYNYLKVAFDNDVFILNIFHECFDQKIRDYICDFKSKWGSIPSRDAIENNFTFNGLCIYTRYELKGKFNDLIFDKPIEKNNGNIFLHSMPKKIKSVIECKKEGSPEKEDLLKLYRGTITKLSDLNNFPANEISKIIDIFGSKSLFIRAINE